MKSTSAIKIATMKNTDNFHYEGKPSRAKAKLTLFVVNKRTQRGTLVSPSRMHCIYCCMPKGTSQAKAMSNGKKIKPLALAVIELHLSEGISQSVSQSVENSI